MKSSVLGLSIKRPVACSMFFVAVALLGLFSWFRIPVTLMPSLSTEQLYIRYYRPASDADVIEREILIPLEKRVNQLSGVTKTSGEIVGSTGMMKVEFEAGSNVRIRELELSRIGAALTRTQPQGTRISVSSQDNAMMTRFAMSIQVTGADNSDALRILVEEQIQPQVAALAGISQVIISGGVSRELTVSVDPQRCAELNIDMARVSQVLQRSVQGLQYLGSSEQHDHRIAVMLDGRAKDVEALGNIRIDANRSILLRHIADISLASAPKRSVYRVNGKPSVAMFIFKDKDVNLVQLGQDLQQKLEVLKAQFNPYGIDLVTSYDASKVVTKQLTHLRQLALSGFFIALLVLFLFLREIRAVAVVAISVPVSLLGAGAMLYLSGYSLNLITLFGLVIGIGMLVDNAIVVYEAVQRNLERGLPADYAAVMGIQRTIRAIITASATNAMVFLPLIFMDAIPVTDRQLLENIVPAILFPLAASLVVAIGLVPLLSHRLAAPAAQAKLKHRAQQRLDYGGTVPPRLAREVFAAVLKVALRRPLPWVTGIFSAILVTVIVALPWVLIKSLSQSAPDADQVRVEVEISGGSSLQSAELVFERLEQAALTLDGVASIESNFQEEQGSATIKLKEIASRPIGFKAGQVYRALNDAINGMDNVQLKLLSANDSNGSEGALANNASQIAISGPDMRQLNRYANDIKQRLLSISQIGEATISSRKGADELLVHTDFQALNAHLLHPEQVLSSIVALGREGEQMPVGFVLDSGREVPLMVRRITDQNTRLSSTLEQLPVVTTNGVLMLGELVNLSNELPPPAIAHQNGRRELRVEYRLAEYAAKTGPQRLALERQIELALQQVYRPEGYTIEALGTSESTDWFKVVAIPIILLLFAVLAMTFESLTLPLLVLLSVPLTILGAVWALFISGLGIDMMAIVGVVVLLGLTVNPAILLVDRMQQRMRQSQCSGGNAAMLAVRERVRPVLMTTCTSIAGLWPLALVTGKEMEAWPPFAVVVMGGLVTSTVLTLVVIPIGFVALSRIDAIFAKLGVWIILLWVTLVATVISALTFSGLLQSLLWQLICALMVGSLLLWLLVRLMIKPVEFEVDSDNIVVEARYLSKVYGQSGPIGEAWHKWSRFSVNYLSRSKSDIQQRLMTLFCLLLATVYLATVSQGMFWRIIFSYLSAMLIYQMIIKAAQLRQWYQLSNDDNAKETGQNNQQPSSSHAIETNASSKLASRLAIATPWLVLVYLFSRYTLGYDNIDIKPELPLTLVVLLAALTLLIQFGRHSAALVASGDKTQITTGRLQGLRSSWRWFCSAFMAFDLKPNSFTALHSAHFRAQVGMIGILGPNGAGKTTLLRLLATVLDSTTGTIHYGHREKRKWGSQLTKLIGYLPQEFGLPGHLTAREYLHYYALLYNIGEYQYRQQVVDKYIMEVGLEQKQDEKIADYSGGMRQRVAIARTLLANPAVIIVDEPTVGLDPRERIRFRNLLEKLSKNRVVLFSTHVVEDVAVSCDRVVVQRKGRIVYDGEPDDLAFRAKNKIWQLKLAQLQIRDFKAQYKVINEIPEGRDMVRLRVLSDHKPHTDAVLVDSTLEDGYMQLLYGESNNHD